VSVKRRGRPVGGDSEATRQRLIDAARVEFATKGYSSSSVASLAEAAGLAPSALYYYFGGKEELFEAVFEATASVIWQDINTPTFAANDFRGALTELINASVNLSESHPFFNDFLALIPSEARMNPRFRPLLQRRSDFQNSTFTALAELGIRSGELRGLEIAPARDFLRCLIMGWFFERHFRSEGQADLEAGVLVMLDLVFVSDPSVESRTVDGRGVVK
jgi:AcrR family transcriptional regulator